MKVCNKPHVWGFVVSPFPNDPAYPPKSTSKEWDLVCRPEFFHPPEPSTPVLRIEQGYVEGGPGYKPRHDQVFATVFNHDAALQLERWVMNPNLWFVPPSVPKDVSGRRIESHACLVALTGTAYPDAIGHFPFQVFPRIIRMLAVTPPTCPLLISSIKSSTVSKALSLLREHGILEREREVLDQSQGVLYHADTLYFTDGPAMSPPNFQLLNGLVTRVLGGPWQPSTILYIKRSGTRSVQAENEKAMLKIIEEESGQGVVVFQPRGNLSEDARMFGQAALVVGPHGAGFTNVLYCPRSAVLLEIGYVGFYPDYYMRTALALDLAYFNLIAVSGDYSSVLKIDLNQFRSVFRAALAASTLRKKKP